MKKGIIFQSDHKEYIVAFCAQTKNGNAAILLRRSGDCLTVSNLKADNRGNYTWDFGYAAGSYDDAVINFMTRVNA